MILTYSGKSAITAQKLAIVDSSIMLNRGYRGDANWGRNLANTRLNPDISTVTNKRKMRDLFLMHGVPMPKLYTIDEAYTAVLTGKVVGRPDRHERGRGLWICSEAQDIERALQGNPSKPAATHFMEYIEAPHEYRAHIFQGKSIRISEKLFNEDGYTTIKPTGEIKHVRKAAKQALEAVGLDFGAVDVLANENECWVLEVNAAPGLGGTLPQLYAETFREWMEEQ